MRILNRVLLVLLLLLEGKFPQAELLNQSIYTHFKVLMLSNGPPKRVRQFIVPPAVYVSAYFLTLSSVMVTTQISNHWQTGRLSMLTQEALSSITRS